MKWCWIQKKCVCFFLFECVTDRRHKRLHATTYFGKLFATLCNRTELNHIHALDIGDGSCNVFFFLSTTAFDPVRLCSAWESTALCGWYSPPTEEKKTNTSVVVPLCFLLVAIEESCYSLRTETRAPIHNNAPMPISPCFVEFWVLEMRRNDVRVLLQTYVHFDSCDSEHRTRHWGLDSILHQIGLSCRISNGKALRYIAKKKIERKKSGTPKNQKRKSRHRCDVK